MNKFNKGQSMVEVILAVGVVVLVITGVVMLIINTVSLKTAATLRKRAGEVADIVVENLLEQKKSNKDVFWSLSPISNQHLSGDYSNFVYGVIFERVTNSSGCAASPNPPNCTNATITVSWGSGNTLVISRFFSI